MTGPLARPRGRKGTVARGLAVALAVACIGIHGAGLSAAPAGGGRSSVKSADTAGQRQGRAGRRFHRRPAHRAPGLVEPAQVRLDGTTIEPGEGGVVLLRVTISGGAEAQHAAFDVGADPDQIRYLGFRSTGRGALIVREASVVPGVVSVYRSALPGGFDSTEVLVELEFEILAAGRVPLALTDVRLLDASGRDLAWGLEVGDLHLE